MESKKKLAIGTKNVDEPKPPTVPAISESRATARNSSAHSMPMPVGQSRRRRGSICSTLRSIIRFSTPASTSERRLM